MAIGVHHRRQHLPFTIRIPVDERDFFRRFGLYLAQKILGEVFHCRGIGLQIVRPGDAPIFDVNATQERRYYLS